MVYFFSVFPACAGVNPHAGANVSVRPCVPRMCGGEPGDNLYLHDGDKYSPHRRG